MHLKFNLNLIILLVFTIDLFRKAFIINTFSNKLNEYQNASNFYARLNTDGHIEELWRKDNIGITKQSSNADTRIMYVSPEYILTLIDDDTKTAYKFKNENIGTFLPVIETASLYSNNFWQALNVAFISKISTENINGKECFKIFINEDFQIFINKENYIKIKEINTDVNTELLEYSFNTVTDNDISLPNLKEYKIIE